MVATFRLERLMRLRVFGKARGLYYFYLRLVRRNIFMPFLPHMLQ